MKRPALPVTIVFALFALFFLAVRPAYAAPGVNIPVTVTQPDGTELHLFATGDEYYNWLHDASGYTIMQRADTGYYVYADLVNGDLVPTELVVGQADPITAGLKPYLNISGERREDIRRKALAQAAAAGIVNAPSTGTINNLVIFIRFAGEPEYTASTATYNSMLNSSTAGANSVRNYFREASYNALTVNSSLFPTPGATIVSYQDSHVRGYFQPYNAATNPIGYTDEQRAEREHALLRDAVDHVKGLGQFPSGAAIDGDNDGYVDDVTFVVSGEPTAWATLLWPHAWWLFSYPVTIDGKQIGGYNLQLASWFDPGVLVHETLHVIGAPDLYHYVGNGIQPVGPWDVMEASSNPPQHIGCYLKYRYVHWISSIPRVSATGTFALNPLTASGGNCFKIPSPNSNSEFFVLEYRNRTGSTFESSLPASGLLVYRINSAQDGQGNSGGPPDEVYVYRPGGTVSVNGDVNLAYFSASAGRTSITDSTDPSSFLSDGSPGGLNISGVTSASSTISFTYVRPSAAWISGNAGIAGATLSYTDGVPKTATADSEGNYLLAVSNNWSGTVTPSKTNCAFTPASKGYTNVTSDRTEENYTASCPPAMPSNLTVGDATESSLTLHWQDNSNNENGFNVYRWGYDGTDWRFLYLDSVEADETSYTQSGLDCDNDFNYYEVSAYNGQGESQHAGWVQGTTLPCSTHTISGSAGVGSATVTSVPGGPCTSDEFGNYACNVPDNWSGTVIPSKVGYVFSPASRTYSNVTTDLALQDYVAYQLYTVTLSSMASQDGWILESGEMSNSGGSMNATATTLILGDDGSNRQYRSILSFSTGGLPDSAVIQSAAIKIKQSGAPVGTNPFSALGNLLLDAYEPYFGTSAALQLIDFNATSVLKVGTFNKVPSSGWYSANLNAAGRNNVNKLGRTQFRLRFALDDNNNRLADHMRFFSGNTPTVTYRPQLVITYYVP